MTYQINYAYTCHAGKVRRNNEDNFWCCGEKLPVQNQGMEEIHTGKRLRESLPVMAVFDGMGGESQGEMASYIAASELEEYYTSHKKILKKNPEAFLEEACQQMNASICKYSRQNRIRAMGTTVAMAAFGKKGIYICNLGDSRIYLMEQGNMRQISKDHVLGSHTFGKAPLTQFLGIEEEEMKLEPFIEIEEYHSGCRLLLCSDGVTDMLSESKIEEILKKPLSVEETVQEMMNQVMDKGARDNSTIIICEIEQDSHPLRTWLLQNKKENEGDIS